MPENMARVLNYLAVAIIPAWILFSGGIATDTMLRALGWAFFGLGFARHLEGAKRQGVPLMAVGVVLTAISGMFR